VRENSAQPAFAWRIPGLKSETWGTHQLIQEGGRISGPVRSISRTFPIGYVVGRIASMLSNRSMPRSVVVPELAYPDIGYAIDWLCKTFGFTLRIRMGDHRAQLNVPGGGALVLIEQSAEVSLRTSVMVRVEDVKAHYDRARRSDVRIVREPTDYPYGERQYNVEDFAGHHWCFSQSIADVDPKEWGGTPGEL
jgi:uncharacterized glyoxalase superfamily protein PhnB